MTTNRLTVLYTLAADRAGSLTGLKGRARKLRDLERSVAIHAERMRSAHLSDDEIEARIAELSVK